MKKLPWFKWFPDKWLSDTDLSKCSPATRGIWSDLVSHMHISGMEGSLTGEIHQLARACRCTPEEFSAAVHELNVTKTADVTVCNGVVTIENRRMKREAKSRLATRLRVQRHRSNDENNGVVTAQKTEDRRQKTEDRVVNTNTLSPNGDSEPAGSPVVEKVGVYEFSDPTARQVKNIDGTTSVVVERTGTVTLPPPAPTKKSTRVEPIPEGPAEDPKEIYNTIRSSLAGQPVASIRAELEKFISNHRPNFANPYVDLWNVWAKINGHQKVEMITEDRKNKIRVRSREPAFDFPTILKILPKLKFYMGENERNWKVDFDFIVRSEKTYVAILEKK